METMKGVIRRAEPDEAECLTELGLRSKAYWGYDDAFMEAVYAPMTVSPAYIRQHSVYVIEANGQVMGFYALVDLAEGRALLDFLFVAPEGIGCGYGKRLWQHAVETARTLGFRLLILESDPHAEGFYRRMGAERVGQRESSVQRGRMLPLMCFMLG